MLLARRTAASRRAAKAEESTTAHSGTLELTCNAFLGLTPLGFSFESHQLTSSVGQQGPCTLLLPLTAIPLHFFLSRRSLIAHHPTPMASGPSPIVVPVNSLAARVPPEVLHHVATCAFESLPPLEGQTERFVYSQVCQSWYSGFHTKQEYIVDHSSKSERLASMLRENNGGVDVRSLDITTVEEDATHVFNMFELLRLCKSVRKLEIVMMYPERVFNSNMILASEDADYNALKSLSDLEHFSICSSTPDAWWGNRAFSRCVGRFRVAGSLSLTHSPQPALEVAQAGAP